MFTQIICKEKKNSAYWVMRNQSDNPHKLLSTVPASVTVCRKCQEPLNPISLNLTSCGELCVLDVVTPAVTISH